VDVVGLRESCRQVKAGERVVGSLGRGEILERSGWRTSPGQGMNKRPEAEISAHVTLYQTFCFRPPIGELVLF
jgi:hypothetical protein